MEPLVVAFSSLALALVSIAVTLWRTRRSYNDTDLEELAEQVGRLARRARADTMRRVRAEKGAAETDVAAADDAPPQLKLAAAQPAARAQSKDDLRRQLLGHS